MDNRCFRTPLFYRLPATFVTLPLAALCIGIPSILLYTSAEKPLALWAAGIPAAAAGPVMLYSLVPLWMTRLDISGTHPALRCFRTQMLARADIRGCRVTSGHFHYLPSRPPVIETRHHTRLAVPGWLAPGDALVSILDTWMHTLTLTEQREAIAHEVQAIAANDELGSAADTMAVPADRNLFEAATPGSAIVIENVRGLLGLNLFRVIARGADREVPQQNQQPH
jgi:hypothetical protein